MQASLSPHNTMSDQQLSFPIMEDLSRTNKKSHTTSFATNKVLPIHRWVPWIAGFSSHFVKEAFDKYSHGGIVLDPFAGVGTTLLDSIVEGCDSIGFEINPYAALACRVKTAFNQIDRNQFAIEILNFETFYHQKTGSDYMPISTMPPGFKTRHTFYSRVILRKVLIIQDFMASIRNEIIRDVFRLAFASNMITFSNYSYEPSLSTRISAGKNEIDDFPVGQLIIGKLREMLEDIKWVKTIYSDKNAQATVINDTFFKYQNYLSPESIELIVTSPPYLNNYHYNRNTRPHLYWLNLAHSPKDFKKWEQENLGKYWQTVREKGTINLDLEFSLPNLEEKLAMLRALNPEKGIYGGNGWANYAATYFNDCYKLAKGVKFALKKGGIALVVIGNSILQGMMVETDHYFGQIAESVGLDLIDIQISRKERVGNSIIKSDVRVEKAKKSDKLYEAVVTLRKA
ncbi:MAG: site-specific DNA-methyltransferase [Candidatus Parabeggiatoa sp. nov. 3]|nr:MAG: site-specific DNA-methyltransferase [Gammaproteobacteria bacterium]RKZ66557.1 MAG: site-specific DNA-methyltransferase [Gammaproteobacteria bacterium]RKZ73459.1 MAG: site-specific DNA-methyltransferase [Gammaproteobacteria bacterium]